ncbi:MAG: hypothetical protein HYY85_15575, partial [Deltaproteobacteria bacterium]|nr:hypothetical protein [Deltaproteobacteria bacterium]
IPWLRPDERLTNETAGVYFDARFPASWDPEYRARHCAIVDFEHAWPAEVRERVLGRWTEYGYRNGPGRPPGAGPAEGA